MTKICGKCKVEKDKSDYRMRSNGKFLVSYCIPCDREYQRNRQNKPENKIKRNKRNKKWREENPFYCKSKSYILYRKKYYKNNKEKIDKRNKENRAKPGFKLKYNKNRQKRFKTDIQYKIQHNLRGRIHAAFKVKSNKKSNKSFVLIGCNCEFLKQHLESLFLPGMSWDNYGKNGWHIDHILPCELFDLTDEKQAKICFNWKNLKPEWQSNNISKNDLLPDGRRARHLTKEEKLEYLKRQGIYF